MSKYVVSQISELQKSPIKSMFLQREQLCPSQFIFVTELKEQLKGKKNLISFITGINWHKGLSLTHGRSEASRSQKYQFVSEYGYYKPIKFFMFLNYHILLNYFCTNFG